MQCSTLVIGGGIVGLAVAARMAAAGPTILVERHAHLLHETSGRHSGVVHAGIYYPDDTLKTRLCLEGSAAIWELHRAGRLEARQCGKWIVATADDEVAALDAIAARMRSRGIPCREVPVSEVAANEPLLSVVKAVDSPRTGIVDAASLAACYTAQLESNGGLISNQTRVLEASASSASSSVRVSLVDEPTGQRSVVEADRVVNCAGLNAHRIARLLPGGSEAVAAAPPLHLWGGRYATCLGKAPVGRLVYPVPLPSLQDLGSHATIDLAGSVRFGPDAFYIGSEGDTDPDSCTYDIAASPGGEAGFLDDIHEGVKRFLPTIRREQLQAGYMGIRPKLSGPADGFQDFEITRHGSVVHCFGIESPGLTASAGVAGHVAGLFNL